MLHSGIAGVHDRTRGEVELAVFVGAKQLTEVALAEAVSRLVQCNRLDINVGVDAPREIAGVVDLTEGCIELPVTIDVGRVRTNDEDEGERCGDNRGWQYRVDWGAESRVRDIGKYA